MHTYPHIYTYISLSLTLSPLHRVSHINFSELLRVKADPGPLAAPHAGPL